jgi:hypothetical protein
MNAPTLPKSEVNNEQPVNTPVVYQISLTPFDQNKVEDTTNTPVQTEAVAVKEGEDIKNPDITSKPQDTPSSFVTLHHELEKHYVLPQYCVPIDYCVQQCSLEACKFKRDCLILKSKALHTGTKQSHVSQTVVTPMNGALKKYKYNLLDLRLMSCFQPDCKKKNSDRPKTFHFGCFMHDTTINSHSGLEVIKVHSKEDKLLTLGNALNYDPSSLNFDELTGDKKHIILPVCGKRCFMNLINRRKELQKIDDVVTKKESNTMDSSSKSAAQQYIHWDKDGSIWTKSSEEVVVDWLSYEENTSSYFGGVDMDGKTSADRKESYHLVIQSLIKKENGKSIVHFIHYKFNLLFN